MVRPGGFARHVGREVPRRMVHRPYCDGVSTVRPFHGPPLDFRQAVRAVRSARFRPEVAVTEIPAPQRLAPHSMAVAAEIDGGEEDLASGRFVLLHDPAGQEAWQGTTRAVTFVRARLESEFADDPLLSDVAWSWVTEALDGCDAVSAELGGTVTRVLSHSHGVLADREPSVEVEIRASWTVADGAVRSHLEAWSTVLCTAAGLPPLPEGVVSLRRPIR